MPAEARNKIESLFNISLALSHTYNRTRTVFERAVTTILKAKERRQIIPRSRSLAALIGSLLLGAEVAGASLASETLSEAHPETITVAVASNFMVPMKTVAKKFEEETGHQVNLAFASSGKLYAQIINGAPFQLFLSADQSKPMALESAGFSVQNSRYTYALGKLALWSGSNDDLAQQSAEQALKKNSFDRLSLANPRFAPYGSAAIEVLKAAGVYADVSDKMVLGENVSQAYQFVATGNVDLGFVSLSQMGSIDASSSQSVWVIPQNLYSPIKQDLVLLKRGEHSPATAAFHHWLRSSETQRLIRSFGYDTIVYEAGID